MTEERSALLAFHGNDLGVDAMTIALGYRGYTTIDTVQTPAELLEKTSLRSHDFYAMDVNLGHPGGYDFSAAQQLYAAIHLRVEEGVARFYPVSVDPRIVEAAKQAGFPAVTKRELEDIIFALPLIRQ